MRVGSIGARYLGDGRSSFRVWAPLVDSVRLHITSPKDRWVKLIREEGGYWSATVDGVMPGTLYKFAVGDASEYSDPASRSQPLGVHGPSEVVDLSYEWTDSAWHGPDLKDYLIYEIHVGTFSELGTFDSMIPLLDYVADLGVTAVELMPVAQFPGGRNWGYDGVYPFAAQKSYGGADGLRRLVNACHERDLAVVLDVVYNHMGPEGNYLEEFGPYFTERYSTPWGKAINFDGPYSDEVRYFFIQNALQWVLDYHIDALRLDAVHSILDATPMTFLEELALAINEEREKTGRNIYLMPESADNNSRLVWEREQGGYGLDAVWSDDFHHALHVTLTGEQNGYYEDYTGFGDLPKAISEGFVYTGQYSRFRHRRHGLNTGGIPDERFIVCCQNHDQVGNRMLGERLSTLVSFEALKLAAAWTILSPFVPLVFMGEEYGEVAPFQYFVSHTDPELVEAVRSGRRAEFSSFHWMGDIPDPQDEATFHRSRLDHELRANGQHISLLAYYRELIRLRKSLSPLAEACREMQEVSTRDSERVLLVRRWSGEDHTAALYNFGKSEAQVQPELPGGKWRKLLDSAEPQWAGPGAVAPDALTPPDTEEVRLAPESVTLFYMGS